MNTVDRLLSGLIITWTLMSSALLFSQNTNKEPGKARGFVEGNYVNEQAKYKEASAVLMSKYKVSYAIWAMVGEPIWDFKFYWERNKDFSYIIKGDRIHNERLKKYPDLWRRFELVRPLSDIKMQAAIVFHAPQYNTDKGYFVSGGIKFTIDLPEKAFEKESSSGPGSPDWRDVYNPLSCISQKAEKYILSRINGKFSTSFTSWNALMHMRKDPNATPLGFKPTFDHKQNQEKVKQIVDELNKILYAMSEKITFLTPKILNIRWPDTEINAIFSEYLKREKEPKKDSIVEQEQKSTELANKQNKSDDDDFWCGNETSSKESKSNNGTDDFWSGAATTAVVVNEKNKSDDFWSGSDKDIKNENSDKNSIEDTATQKKQIECKSPLIYGGQSYKTVLIGNQCWMAENLNYNTGNSWCYNNNNSNCNKYGRLFDWKTAIRTCPSGWHLPSDYEWKILVTYLGGDRIASGKMKSTTGWQSPNTGATNSSGFTALPGGYRGTNESFFDLGFYGYWWSVTEDNPAPRAWDRSLQYKSTIVDRFTFSMEEGRSVRCLKD